MLFADTSWHDMFYLNLPVIEKILRPIVVYVFLILGVRLAGKRQLAQLNPFDLIVLLTLANTVQNAIIGDDNSVTGGLIGAATLLLVNYVVVWFLFGHQKLEHLIEGDADVLVEAGKVHKDRLRRELITEAELEAVARRQGFSSLKDVERAILEPGGNISIVARKPEPDEMRHGELLMRLEELLNEVRKLGASPQSKPA
ncbi:MAG TPA: YetF domain-containing protein [Pirellulales bacterium]|jgi:uncharacterized membrane protein YcaP (DUF421 family)|nr:YetF domain-containing protein [Pirellulales bacterium]